MFTEGFKKVAQNPFGAAVSKSFKQSTGTSGLGRAWGNLKSGLGFGGGAQAAAPKPPTPPRPPAQVGPTT